MPDNKNFWDSYFSGNSDAPDYQPPADEETKEIPTASDFTQDDPTRKVGAVSDSSAHYDAGDTGPENFKVDFDFDGEYRDVPTAKPFVPRREKRSGCVGGLLYGIFIICVSVVAAVLLWMAAADVLALGKEDSEVIVTISEDMFYEGTVAVEDDEGNVIGEEPAELADIDKLADVMYDAGLIKYKFIFKLFCRLADAETKVGAGTYTLNTKYDYRALISGTTPTRGQRVEVSVTIPEGYTLAQIITVLEEKGVCTADDMWDAVANYAFEDKYSFLEGIPAAGDKYRLEGFMFPDTYYFYMGDDPVRVVNKFLDNFEVKFGQVYIDRATELGYSVYDIVIISSMIERESSGHEGERDMIASVIYNRLRSSNFPYLQLDATILYGMARNGDEDLPLSTSYDSPYNTYTNQGLPPGPVSNPGEAAIRGALYPETSNYYYYALHKDGYHEFFTNYNSFLNFINSDNYGG